MRFRVGHVNRTKRRPPLDANDYMVERRGYPTPCWIRRGFVTTAGYSRVTIAGKSMYAHRAMYEQVISAIPEGMDLDHLCRQPRCINPDHLEPVPRYTNLQRGRGAKLTEDEVREIRAAPREVQTKELARRYGISRSHMSRVRRGVKYVLSD